MTSIAHGKAFWIGSDLKNRTVEFSIEVVCSLDAPLGVPFQGFGKIDLGGRAYDDISHPAQPREEHAREPLPTVSQSSHQNHRHRFGDWPP